MRVQGLLHIGVTKCNVFILERLRLVSTAVLKRILIIIAVIIYTNFSSTIDDSDWEESYDSPDDIVQVEFDDGDSSSIPIENIRLLPCNYPILRPDAPFMMHFTHRRRNTSGTGCCSPA